MSETVKTLLKNGTVVSGDISVREDVLIEGEKIIKVGQNLEAEDAQVVDVSGKLLFPGFIDGHTHFDLEVAGTVTADDFETGTSEDHELEGVSSLSLLYMTQNYAAAELWTEEENMLKIYDADWNEILTFSKTDTQSDYYGYVTAFVETENGWIAFDSYAGKAIFGGFDGAIYGEVDISDLFGVSYFCSINDACTNPDGSVSVAITDEREDESCYETLIFNLSGF